MALFTFLLILFTSREIVASEVPEVRRVLSYPPRPFSSEVFYQTAVPSILQSSLTWQLYRNYREGTGYGRFFL